MSTHLWRDGQGTVRGPDGSGTEAALARRLLDLHSRHLAKLGRLVVDIVYHVLETVV